MVSFVCSGQTPQFSYDLVDCDGPAEAYRICIREPKDCSAGKPYDGIGNRKKREANQDKVATLDWIFKNQKRAKSSLKIEANKAKGTYRESFKKMDLEKSYPALFEILWYTQLPCFDIENVTSVYRDQYGMLKGCFWKGVEMPCSQIFDMFPTDQGMCCTFNLDKAEKMFKDGKYKDMAQKMQNRDKSLSFDRNVYSYETWEENGEPTAEAGLSKGLQVILDAHSNLLAGGTVTDDFYGFYAIIDAKDQYPMTSRKSILLRPGHSNLVSMTATKITSKDINDIEPLKRNCLFPGDKEMNVHKNYSQGNCILECQLSRASSKVLKCLFIKKPYNADLHNV